MKRLLRSQFSKVCLFSVLAIVLLSGTVSSQEPRRPGSVTVSFGAGLNTAQPGNKANHHIMPMTIRITAGSTVNFAVAGFHQIYVYLPGKRPEHVVLPPVTIPPTLFINDKTNIYYEGILPAGGPPPGIPATTNPSNAVNRIESVSFATPGTYLVICNVTPHFIDGMWAWVVVT